MKIILVFVSSLDSKVTKWHDPFVRKWSSKADQNYFGKLWKESSLIVLGSNTFDADQINPLPDHLLIVMTRRPAEYKKFEVSGQVEFSDKSPSELATHYEMEGFEQMVVVGGPHIATSFLKEHLIDELWLTIEPKIFGIGACFVTSEQLDIDLQLIDIRKANEQGTLITKYAVLRK
jgi:dihydrofolate reductase